MSDIPPAALAPGSEAPGDGGLCLWPDWLPGYDRRPDPNHSKQTLRPTGVVLHCGDKGADLADAALKMPISYHFAWDVVPGQAGRFVQLVSLRRRAWHAGPAGNGAVGIALSGPPEQDPRSAHELAELQVLLLVLREAFGGRLRWWCRHSDIEERKRDPGPGVTVELMASCGLEWRRA